ncbi:MAG TPA: glycosyltransferase family 4 protein, partial [Solirubrobacterales bacterium]|nr:glycosyltransferase family 4 protein [Solirubrobacterales bacterium]
MRVLIFHGYMLRGTGSNIYNANLAPALARLGHEVHLLSQDRRVRLEGVEVHNPDIGGLLPVYVKDPYEGFEVKTFSEMSEGELDRYLDANVAAVRAVAESAGEIDVALANHLVMGPAILARAGVAPFAAKVHGSALEYTVKPDPRFVPYAREGVEAANGVLVGSRHTAESLWAALPEVEGLRERTRLGPPGVDVEEFRPCGEREPLVAYVGKLIVSKGVDLLLAAWPLVLARHPAARLVVVGFGAYRATLEALQAALAAGDLAAARAIAAAGREPEGGPPGALRHLDAFLRSPAAAAPAYAAAATRLPERVVWCGRLEHAELAELLPACEAQVVPSTFPEAFGMVAAEAAACGVLPVSAAHSGLAEVTRRLAQAVPAQAAPLLAFTVGPGAVEEIAARLTAWLDAPAGLRARTRDALVATARERFSWGGVAAGVLSAAAG